MNMKQFAISINGESLIKGMAPSLRASKRHAQALLAERNRNWRTKVQQRKWTCSMMFAGEMYHIEHGENGAVWVEGYQGLK